MGTTRARIAGGTITSARLATLVVATVTICGILDDASSVARAAPQGPSSGSVTVILFDPDADYQLIPRIIVSLEEYLRGALGEAKVVGVPDAESFKRRARETEARLAIVPQSLVTQAASMKLRPLVRPERAGLATYHKVFVAPQGVTGEKLRSARIATADTGARGAGRARLLRSLNRAGVDVADAQVLPLSKDIDALFALTVGQADAALVRVEAEIT